MLDEKKEITRYLKDIRLASMGAGKCMLRNLIYLRSESHRIPTMNDLLTELDFEPLSYGDDWGWPHLQWDLLSNKYGVVAIRDIKRKITEFHLRMPPVERIHPYSTKKNEENDNER